MNNGSLDTTPDVSDIEAAIDQAHASGHRTIQILIGYAPANTGAIRYLPDENLWPGCAVEASAFIEAAHKRCILYGIELLIEIYNEWDTKVGAAFDTVKNEFLWKILGLPAGSVPYEHFRYIAFMVANINTQGRKLCMHQAGGGGTSQKAMSASWKFRDGSSRPNDAAASIIKAVKDSGGFFAYNTYPNLTFNSSPKALCDRYNGYTVPNTGAIHVASPMGGVPWRVGETQIKRGANIPDGSIVRFRQAFFDSIKAAGRSYTAFAMTGDANYAFFDDAGKPILGLVSL